MTEQPKASSSLPWPPALMTRPCLAPWQEYTRKFEVLMQRLSSYKADKKRLAAEQGAMQEELRAWEQKLQAQERGGAEQLQDVQRQLSDKAAEMQVGCRGPGVRPGAGRLRRLLCL